MKLRGRAADCNPLLLPLGQMREQVLCSERKGQ